MREASSFMLRSWVGFRSRVGASLSYRHSQPSAHIAFICASVYFGKLSTVPEGVS